MNKPLATLVFLVITTLFFTVDSQRLSAAFMQVVPNPNKYNQVDKFRQLEEILPTPGETRTASGAPGRSYWQQRADHEIDVTIDDTTQRLTGQQTITYHNASPDSLTYLWLQLDGNIHKPNSDAQLMSTIAAFDRVELNQLRALLSRQVFDGSFQVTRCVVADTQAELPFTVVKTMMRVDLPEPLQPQETFRFSLDWNYQINDAKVIRARSGYEFFPDDGNYIYEMAQWFPRMCAYTDATGWQHKQFLGSGEFTLELGDYLVRITMPADHVVTATGVLLNPQETLTESQRQRLQQAEQSDRPLFVITPEEAKANQTSRVTNSKTWIFKADNVRDFAFASSRKFIWDACGHRLGSSPVMAMSFYPIEGEPLWSKYSTQAIIHTLNVYSRYTFDYPYPVAISVNGPVGGMEYPMICFNGPRPEADGTYSQRIKYGLISVIIHEVGHNYFPMIVNSDERQWTWMDEGLNTFLQFLAEREWEENYPSRRGEPRDIIPFMVSENQVPVMTNSESLLQFGPNAYAKPATALVILRESILGRELFDFAFQEYARRWKFKRPMPADFFRTMEDASGVDLDWFWRGWFYTTDHVDLAITGVRQLNVNTQDPNVEKQIQKELRDQLPASLTETRNADSAKRVAEFPELKDFYNSYDPLDVIPQDRATYESFLEKLTDDQRQLMQEQRHFYLIDFQNVGGLVMPLFVNLKFADGSTEMIRIPAEIWAKNNQQVTKLFITEKEVVSVELDPNLETADADVSNNFFPPKIQKSRFELFQEQQLANPMQQAQQAEEKK